MPAAPPDHTHITVAEVPTPTGMFSGQQLVEVHRCGIRESGMLFRESATDGSNVAATMSFALITQVEFRARVLAGVR